MAKTSGGKTKTVNLALQGGGAHGAFTWGVLDGLLAHPKLEFEGITATSAGAVNAVVMAQGLLNGGPEAARELLATFWHRVSIAAKMLPLQPSIIDKMLGNTQLEFSPSFVAVDFLSRMFSPYQYNMIDLNPLRSILEETVDFHQLRRDSHLKLFINATQVRTGKPHIFKTEDISLDVVMASACLPFIFKTVEIDGEPYWDGGYSGNPALFPLFYRCTCRDIILVQINPLCVEEIPTQASDILDRVNEISFNSSLMQEIRAVLFVKKLLEQNKVSPKDYKDILLHVIEAQEMMQQLGRSSKLNADWDFLQHLRDIGQQTADDWLGTHYQSLGKQSSVDVESVFL